MSGPAFNREFDPAYGTATELSPLIRRIVAKNPNPFTFTGTGVILLGRGDVAVIDPGPSLDEHIEQILGALGPDEQITRILVTHTHTDHTAGVAKLKARTGATTIGFGPHGEVGSDDPMEQVTFDEYFTAEEKAEIEKAWSELPDELKREGADTDFVPDIAVIDGEEIDSEDGTWNLEVVHTPGHASNHIAFALRQENLLFSGDHVMGWATSVISAPDGDLVDYMDSLEKVARRSETVYLPTHGPAIEDPEPYVRSFIAHRLDREAQIVAALREGPSTIKDMVPAMYADTNKQLWRAAAGSVYSHLLALYRQERAAPVEGDPSPVAIWHLR